MSNEQPQSDLSAIRIRILRILAGAGEPAVADRLRHGAVPHPHQLDEQRQPDAQVRAGRLGRRGDARPAGSGRSRIPIGCGPGETRQSLTERVPASFASVAQALRDPGGGGPRLLGDRSVDPRHACSSAVSIPASAPSSGRTTWTGTRSCCWSSRWWSARFSSSATRRRRRSRPIWNARRPAQASRPADETAQRPRNAVPSTAISAK